MGDSTEVICGHEAHEVFARAFATHQNAAAAFRRAYPEASPRTVDANAYKLTRHPDVVRRVAELMAARREQILEQTRDLEVLVANLALGKAADMFDADGRLLPIRELPTEVKNALKSVKLKESTRPDGTVVRTFEYELPDPLAAARLLAQLRGALVERSDITSGGRPLPAPVDPKDLPALDAELRQRLLAPPEDDAFDLVG